MIMKLSKTEKQKFQKTAKQKFQQKKEKNNLSKLKFVLALMVAAIGFLLYFNSIRNEYVLDDYPAIKENFVTKQGISAIPLILKTPYRYGYWTHNDKLYRPLSLLMFAAEWEYFPDNPHVNHFINVLLFSISGFFLFLLLCKLFPAPNLLVPFVCSILYIAHPIHTEVVANIKSRDEILALLFMISTTLFALKYLEKKSFIILFATLVSYFLSLLSKENAITFFVLVPFTVYFFSNVSLRKIFPLLISLAIVTGIYLLIRQQILKSVKFDEPITIINNSLAGTDFSSRFASAFFILGKYILLLLFPHPLAYDYSFNQIPLAKFTDFFAILSFLFYVLIVVFAIMKLKKKDFFSFSIFLFLIPLALVSNVFILIESTMAERFLFIPSLGFCLAIALLFNKFLSSENSHFNYQKLSDFFSFNKKIMFIIIPVLILYSIKTISRNNDWKDNLTLYSNDIKIVANSARAHYLLGNELIKFTAEKESDKTKKEQILKYGINELAEAIKIYPTYSDAFNQTGVAYYKMGNFEKSREFLLQAQNYNNQNAEVKSNLGSVYFSLGQKDKAEEMYRQALTLNPNYVDALRNLGSVCGETSRYDEALIYFLRALKIEPLNSTLLYYIGLTYRFKKDEANANTYLNKAYELNPNLRGK